MSKILVANELGKTYQDGSFSTDVFKGINFELNAGEKVAIVGASGSGKSTLLHLLAGLEKPSSGQIELMGKAFSELSEAKRGKMRNLHMGFVYQFHHLLPELNALENVMMPLLVRRLSVKQAEADAKALLERVGLGQRLMHKPTELSGGERQRVSLARALITKPDCVLADEPTGNLDGNSADQVFDLMLELNTEQQTALLIVTHDMALAAKLDRQVVLQKGSLLQPTP